MRFVSSVRVYRLVDEGVITPEEGAAVLFAQERAKRAEYNAKAAWFLVNFMAWSAVASMVFQ